MSGSLSLVATPIGNLADITLRALDVLRAADLVVCEDTRHTRILLAHYGIDKPLMSLHQHNERQATLKILAELEKGKHIALVADAGTPGISDPGAYAVSAVRRAGFPITPIPGPNAAIAALSISGFTGPFHFVGFLPAKAKSRQAEIATLKAIPALLVFYEAPHRIKETLADLVAGLESVREIFIARELTKRFEECTRLPLTEAPRWLEADENRQRGEFVLIVSAPPDHKKARCDGERLLALLLEELPVSQAARIAAKFTGEAKHDLYAKALARKGG
ncbi:MAG: 16S rRNA (cytidine(1402)-2'-O)-methyltransferase [Rhodocyclaceae bacterium]|nr:16S rRNA (cytidine(1402)-2'-O)-methyltransferase [Rhodocyclaceae bacterium]